MYELHLRHVRSYIFYACFYKFIVFENDKKIAFFIKADVCITELICILVECVYITIFFYCAETVTLFHYNIYF